MKNTLALILALCMILGFAALETLRIVHAESMTIAASEDYGTARDVGVAISGELYTNDESDYLGWRPSEYDNWRLIDAQGNPVTDAIYTDMRLISSYKPTLTFFRVSVDTGDPANCWGILNSDGTEVVPPQYTDVRGISDHWCVGIYATEATGEERDYIIYDRVAGEKRHYIIDSADFYYDGALAGSVGRDDFSGGNIQAYGDYLCVERPDGQYGYFDRNLTRSPIVTSYGTEYDSNYDYDRGGTVYIHCGTGMEAFTSGCTLTASEVAEAYHDDYDGQILDLQGNVILNIKEKYSYASEIYSHYIKVRADDKYGLIDFEGREILAPEYDDVGTYGIEPFSNGFIYAEKGTRFGYLDIEGRVTCPFVYPTYRNYDCAMFMQIDNPDGSASVLSASSGELPETYKTLSYIRDNSLVYAAQRFDDTWCCANDRGELLLDGVEAKSLWVNSAGTLAVSYLGDGNYELYALG